MPYGGNKLMKRILSLLTLSTISAFGTYAFAQQVGPEGIAESAAQQIAEIIAIKRGFTIAQMKVDSNLVFAAKAASGELTGTSVADITSPAGIDVQGNVTVDI